MIITVAEIFDVTKVDAKNNKKTGMFVQQMRMDLKG